MPVPLPAPVQVQVPVAVVALPGRRSPSAYRPAARMLGVVMLGVGVILTGEGMRAAAIAPAPGGADPTPVVVELPAAPAPVGAVSPQLPRPGRATKELRSSATAESPAPSPPPVSGAPPVASRPAPWEPLRPDPGVVVTRVIIPAYDIDLPVVSGELDVPGNGERQTLCDVAQYLAPYVQPAVPGTTYLYAHARVGMFLPLLTASQHDDGRALLGAVVKVDTTGGWRFRYEIFKVKRHATDFTLADRVAPGEHRLVLQTSEGPRGTRPKLQVAARLLSYERVTVSKTTAHAEPRVCV